MSATCRDDAERDERVTSREFAFDDGVFVTIRSEDHSIQGVFICSQSVFEVTADLDAGSGTWTQRRRWYSYLNTFAEEPRGVWIDGDGLAVFIEVYGHRASEWYLQSIEDDRALRDATTGFLESAGVPR